jgi:murein DD-endopeptidase MepM/ murein hydrolase activator NlpD
MARFVPAMNSMFNGTKIFHAGFLGFLLISIAGCVTLRTQEETSIAEFPAPARQGVYHKVKEGQTLWRIAKTYNVAIDDITRVNNIPKAARIEKNQLVFIPGADTVREIVLDTDNAQNEFIWPIQGKVIKYFHERQGDWVSQGVDIEAREGDAVKAARTGRVVFADYLSGYGYTVILDHSDGFHSVYAKNSKLLVKLDELVPKNRVIAQVGRSSDLAYLHFEIRKNSIEDNPLYYLP